LRDITLKSSRIFLSLFGICTFLGLFATKSDKKINYQALDTDYQQNFSLNTLENNAVFEKTDSNLIFPINDRYGNYGDEQNNSSLDLNDPKNIKRDMEYNPETREFEFTETVGDDVPYRSTSSYSLSEYMRMQNQRAEDEYWQEKSQEATSFEGRKGIVPKLKIPGKAFDKIFGGSTVDIRPQGNIDIILGGNYQKIDNPVLIEQNRRTGGFDFDMNINMNVVGNIGDKIKLNTNYNTLANFDFENQMRINYGGDEDAIIQKFEAGNVSMPLKSSLITGSQSLFGVKTTLKFGRATITGLVSQQKSQTQEINVQGGTQLQTFKVPIDEYDQNRHFFVSQYNRNNFNNTLKSLPNLNSLFKIVRMEVWVTNSTTATTNVRDVVAFMDLGEPNPYNESLLKSSNPGLPDNNSNNLYEKLITDPALSNVRQLDFTEQRLLRNPSLSLAPGQSPNFPNGYTFSSVQDFEITRARQLNTSEFTFHPELGFISLNITLQPDEVLACAVEYFYNGKKYQLGEFAQDYPVDPTRPNVLFLKMLKATSPRVKLPIWDLMMKNVYSTGAFQVNPQDFKLDVVYQDPDGGFKRYIPQGACVEGIPLLRLMNLDRLNNQTDPQADGIFDFIPGVTILPQNGRIIFPLVEPFGNDLKSKFCNDPVNAERYAYQALYDSTIVRARETPEKNRFFIQGSYKSTVASEISLGAFNVPQGSVRVMAGGQQLREGIDYTIDYYLGKVKILNDGIMNSGLPIKVNFENNALFGFQVKTLVGSRLDYYINDNLSVGATFMRLTERPFTNKINIGDDPISNMVFGADVSYNKEAPWLTRFLDKLPGLQTKAPSSITFSGEAAYLKPGHSKALGKEGRIYIDDFEGTTSNYELKQPTQNWAISSVPSRFQESQLIDSVASGYNRARLSWYSIDPGFWRSDNVFATLPANDNKGVYTRQFLENEIFPNTNVQFGQGYLPSLDLAYYPQERGPYNFDVNTTTLSAGVDAQGKLRAPETRWAGITRALDINDFENANVEFVEFWMVDPFKGNTNNGGKMYVNLGNISEDILRDSRKSTENALPKSNDPNLGNTQETNLARVSNTQSITNAFDNDPDAREAQDVGFDGLNNDGERRKFARFINDVNATITNTSIREELNNDPANDDYHYYRGTDYDAQVKPIIERYKKYNMPQGNSPTSERSGEDYPTSATNRPDNEDLNLDNTLLRSEEYFEYEVDIDRNMTSRYITDKVTVNDNTNGPIDVYQFRIPINDPTVNKVGGIQDFRSIRFMRIYLTGFTEPIVLRLPQLRLVRNQWRKLEKTPFNNSGFLNVAAVNYEQNNNKRPVNYILPPGIEREQSLGPQPDLLQNEASLSMVIENLQDNDSKAVYKLLNLDMRRFKQLEMFIHANSLLERSDIQDDQINAFIRIGSDFDENYYEYEMPLKITPAGAYDNNSGSDKLIVWPEANKMQVDLEKLRETKAQRNRVGANLGIEYQNTENTRYKIKGSPDLGYAKLVMIGVRNPSNDNVTIINAEVWANELRLTQFDERGGYAALGRTDIRLADLGTLTASANYTSQGWGGIEQRIQQRQMESNLQYDATTSLELGKFLPKSTGIKIPFYAGYSNQTKTPEWDPYDFDLRLKDKVNEAKTQAQKDSVRKVAQDITTIKTINVSNLRKDRVQKVDKEGKPLKPKPAMPYDIENVTVSYSYVQTARQSPILESEKTDLHRASLNYAYTPKPLTVKPFDRFIRKKYLSIIKDFNFNPVPNNLTFNTNVNRQFNETRLRNIEQGAYPIPATYNKFFTWDRNYALKWDLTKSLSIDFNAMNNARIDEPFGRIDTKEKKDTVWNNIKNFGRNTAYQHTANVNYSVPIDKLPLMDWTQVRAKYGTTYNWNSGALLVRDTLGNTIQNTQDIVVNGDFNFTKLYTKSKYLRKILEPKKNQKNQPKKPDAKEEVKINEKADGQAAKGDTEKQDKNLTKEEKERLKKLKKKKERFPTDIERVILTPLMAIKKVSLTYTERQGSLVPGFMPQHKILGMNSNASAPGWDYVFGGQPSSSWLDRAATKDWITDNPYLNQQYTQNYTQIIEGRASLEPFKDFKIEVNLTKNYTRNHTEFFKDTLPNVRQFDHLSPMDIGSYTISYLPIRTWQDRFDTKTYATEAFQRFEENRHVISRRLGEADPNSYILPTNDTIDTQHKYYYGYGRNNQDVMIPSFIAAYTNQDPNKVKLNFFKQLPLPNWRLNYTGLSRIGIFKKWFNNFGLTHAYKSSFTVNRFSTDLDYVSNASQLDTNRVGNFFSRYEIPAIIITENFSPLVGIDISWKNNLSTRFDYNKGRNLSMSFIDNQLIENRNEEITIGIGYRVQGGFQTLFGKKKKGVKKKTDTSANADTKKATPPPPSNTAGKGRKKKKLFNLSLNNDLNFKFDFSYRNDLTINHQFDQNYTEPTRGAKTIRISPSIDYVVNNRLNLRLFYDRNQTIPATSQSFPITTTRYGLNIRFTLQ